MADIEVTVSPATVTTVSVPSPVATPSVIYTGVQGPPGEGSSYDQNLNTTDSPTFSSLTIDNGDGATASVIPTGFTISDGDNHANVSAVHISGSTDTGHGGTYYLDYEGVGFGIGDNTNAEVPTSHYGHGVIEYKTTSSGTKTFNLPAASGTLALTSDVRSFGGVGYVFVTVTGNDVAPPPGGYYVITNSSNYYTQAAVYINEVNQSAKIYFSSGSWRLLNAATGTEYVQGTTADTIPGPVPVINYTGTDSNGSPCSCSITFSSYFQSARPVSTVGNGSTNSAGTSQLVAHADHSHALASNVVTLTGQQTLTNKSITSSQIIGLATVATSGSASDLGTGTLSDNRLSSNIPRMSGGLIQASNLPSYVDDVLEYTTTSNFPATGESGKIYVATGTGLIYRWTGSIYVEISPSTAQVQTDWNASSGLGVILNKPTLSSVATSGSASDLGTGILPDARLSTEVVTLTGTQTLTNKSISAAQITGLATIATSGSASDLGTGTLPDARLSSNVVTLTGTQTLTNKSISSGQITGLATVATSGSASDLGTGTLPDDRLSSNVVTLTGTQTLTNKSISSGQITGLGTASAKDIPATGNASATQVVYGSDTRLTDARTPSSTLAHASSHASGGSDALTLSASQITGLASVATSGAYSALSGTPSLASVATSGSYTDLSNLPVIAKKSTADMNSTNTTLADVTGLTNFVLEANTMYRFEFAGRHTCVSGGSQYLVLNSTQAIANASAQGWYVIFGSRTDAGFSNPSGNLYAFINRSSTGNTNNPSAAVYYIVTGSSAPTMKIQFSQTGTATGTATLLSGAVAVFTKLI
jgi:hypothetical protein